MRPAFSAGIFGLVLSLGTVAVAQTTRPSDSPETRVAVLPFESLSGADHTAVAETIGRSVARELSRVSGYQIVTSDTFAQDAARAVEAGKEAGADFVVWGTVQVTEDRMRIAGELLDV